LDVDKSTTQDKAKVHAAAGQFDKAIGEWKKLLIETTDDAIIHNTIGDLYVRQNALADAITAYFQGSNLFRQAGETLKAIAILKKIIKLDPGQHQAYQDMAEMNAERGLVGSAIADYTSLAKLYLREDKVLDAVGVYRTMVSLDPSRQDVTRYLAELCMREQLLDEAAVYYLQLARICAQKGLIDEAKEVYDSILKFSPEHEQALKFKENPELALQEEAPIHSFGETGGSGSSAVDEVSALIDSGEFDQAEAKLVELMGADPASLDLCRQFGRLYLRKGEPAVARSQYQYVADTALQSQDLLTAESALQEYLGSDPMSAVIRELLGRTLEQKGDADGAMNEYGQALESMIRDEQQDQPVPPDELYERMKTLAPDSPWVERFARGLTVDAIDGVPTDSTIAETAVDGMAVAEPMSSAEEPPAFTIASSEPSAEEPALSESALDTPSVGGRVPPYQQHLDLGIAYRDMGLVDEAIAELSRALEDPSLYLQAMELLVDSYKRQGAVEAALACLERSATDPSAPDSLSESLQYEFGLLYLNQGRMDRAAEVLSAIPDFRDVREHLARLRGATGRSEPVATGGTKRRRVSYL